MPLDDLPRIDEHSVHAAAAPDAVFDAIHRRFTGTLSGRLGQVASRAWGCEPSDGFEVTEEHRPDLIVLAGRHRFSRYAIVFRIIPTDAGSTLSAESRAEFPGLHGRAYRAAVIGTRFHVLATRALLRNIATGVVRSK